MKYVVVVGIEGSGEQPRVYRSTSARRALQKAEQDIAPKRRIIPWDRTMDRIILANYHTVPAKVIANILRENFPKYNFTRCSVISRYRRLARDIAAQNTRKSVCTGHIP